ncbi:hypothetical protein GCM10018953_02270 [Streptosporangium nondiastaticum]
MSARCPAIQACSARASAASPALPALPASLVSRTSLMLSGSFASRASLVLPAPASPASLGSPARCKPKVT